MTGWVAGGFWQPALHHIPQNAAPTVLDGVRYWWSDCTAMCVQLPQGTDMTVLEWCTKCFPPKRSGGSMPKELCLEQGASGARCTMPKGHTGDHIAESTYEGNIIDAFREETK